MGFFSDSDTERAKTLLKQAQTDPGAVRDEVETLAGLLGSEELEARRAATAALAALAKAGPGAIEPAFQPLVDGLVTDDEVVRQNAAVAVTQVATEYPGAAANAAVGPLVQCVVEERGGHPQATAALKVIADEHPDALRSAVDGLRSSLRSDDATTRERVTAIFAAVAAGEPAAVEPVLDDLTARLADERVEVREHAAQAIFRVAEERPAAVSDAVGPLTRRLSDAAAVARPALKTVARVAAVDGGAVRPAVPELEPLLGSDDPDVRRGAVAALLHVAEADERAVRPILSSVEPLLDDEDARSREFATGIYGLVSEAAPELAAPVAEPIAGSLDREPDRIRRVAVAVLRRVATTKPAAVRPAFDALIDRLDDADDTVRENAAGAVSRVARAHPEAARARSAALIARLDADEPTARLHAIRALRHAAMENGDWIDADAVRSVAPRLTDDETDVRGEAAMAMTTFAIEAPGLVPDQQVRRLPTLLRTAAGMSDDMVTESADRLETATGVDIDPDAGGSREAAVDRRETADADEHTTDRAVTVEQAGVVVEKQVDTESFPRRAVRLLVANRSGRAVEVRVVDTPLAGVAASAVEFHSDYHPDGWSIHEDHGLMEFEQRLDAGATVETVYGSPNDAPHDTGGELEPPTVSVDTDAARGNSPAAGTTDHVPPQPAVPAADVDGVAPPPERDLTDVAGMTDLKQRLQEEVLVPLADDRYEEYGFDGVTNILLHGPPGTGKTYLAEALAGHLGYNYVAATASDIASDVVGQAPSNVAELFERARAAAPSVLFIDEIDSVAADRSGTGGMTTSEQQMVTQLLTEIESLNESDEPVLLVAATNRIEAVDDAIERPGRFDARLSVRKPDGEDRLEILQYHLDGVPVDRDGIDEDALVTATEGFAASHLAEVADAAGRTAVRETSEGEEPTVTAARLHEAIEDLQEQRKAETTERRFLRDPPEIDFDDVVGLEEVKTMLREKVVDPLENPKMFRKLNLSIDRGVLLYGPPGTGKTHLARALAGELDSNYVQASAADLVSKYIGEGAKNVRTMFEEAQTHQPCLVFVDEFDALATDRSADQTRSERQMVNEFLDALSNVENADDDVIVVGATNRPDDIDPAMKRSGRLNERIEVPPPDRETRVALFREYLHTDAAAVDEEWLGRQTTGLVASDMERLATEATRAALNRHRAEVGGLSEVDVEEVEVTRDDVRSVLDELHDEREHGTESPRIDVGDGSG
jgi:SpoVK/Ycf46/Vps4 family AAA+-type ATPase